VKPWLKSAIRKQKRQHRRQFDIVREGDGGTFHITDPLEWSNLIAERVGYARYNANKKNEELGVEETHALMGTVIREAQEEILGDPNILAFYLARIEAAEARVALEHFARTTDRFVPDHEGESDEEGAT
jgi:hypothetical protein